jgi:hypothetical protein
MSAMPIEHVIQIQVGILITLGILLTPESDMLFKFKAGIVFGGIGDAFLMAFK